MSNQSYLYSIGFNPSERSKTEEDVVYGLSEYPSSVPMAYLVLASVDAQLCPSLIWEHEHPTAILANYEKGRHRLFAFLDAVAKVGAFDSNKLNLEIEKTKRFLNNPDNHSNYVLLELGEIFDFNDEPHEVQAQNFLKDLKNIDATMTAFLSSLAEWKKEIEENEMKLKVHNSVVFKLLFGFFSGKRKAEIEKEMKRAEDSKWFDLGIDEWGDILYFDLNEAEEEE